MLKYPTWKLCFVFAICALFAFFALPNFISYKPRFLLPQSKINYGLDLRGGSQLLLKVDFQKYINSQLSVASDLIRSVMRKEGINYVGLKSNDDKIIFSIKNTLDLDKMQNAIAKSGLDLEMNCSDGVNITVEYSKDRLTKMREEIIEQSREIIRYRIDENGTLEPSITRHGDSGIMVQVPGLSDPEQLRRLLGKTAQLTLNLVENAFSQENKPKILPHNFKLIKGDADVWYVVNRSPALAGNMLVDARFVNSNGQPAVSFSMNSVGAKIFGDITKVNQNRRLAIILDDRVISAPMINEPILNGSGIISGQFTINEANELALLLRAGSLPAPLIIAEEKIVGPALGDDSIALGKTSGMIAVIATMVFMVILYSVYGVFASIALAMNLIIIISIMTILQATLTMPGIAGVILTMGMAVDANVLIFERIRDEASKTGSFNGYAIEKGFERAFATIFDSNFTTLIAAFFLYAFGSGMVKGFAVTLAIGILSSMFTAITLTKIFIYFWMKPGKLLHT